MRLEKMVIDYYRSIEHAEIYFPEKAPVILFGPNNVGKSNILKAIECILGERNAAYIDFQDSDYFLRDKDQNPHIHFEATFDENMYPGSNWNPATNRICFTTHFPTSKGKENCFHYSIEEDPGKKIFLSNDDKEKCQFIVIDASRDINRQLSYFSQYSILSRMSKKMHESMAPEIKQSLGDEFLKIKGIFESVPEYKSFYDKLQNSFESNIDGFEHRLEIDLQSYDPNNYFNSLRIIAKEGLRARSFEEFGTGEQQILLMAFVKAYAETFKGENFILGIEEPEAHLHPLAQKWLAKNISKIAESGVQVIITTHSPEFLDIEYIEGFVKVYKDNNITKTLQHSAKSLSESCISLKANSAKTTELSILSFYKSKTFYDQLRGFFARKIILVEGETEFFALPNYFKNCGYDLIRNGVEIVNCRGKGQITRNYRLFKSYGYKCFCLFDADSKKVDNVDFALTFIFDKNSMNNNLNSFIFDKEYGYFGKDFESYMRVNIADYSDKEKEVEGEKVLKAKIISENNSFVPDFIEGIAISLDLTNNDLFGSIKIAEEMEEFDLASIPF